jgi:hypothetical protein
VGDKVWRTLGGATIDMSALYQNRRIYSRWLTQANLAENWVDVESWATVPRFGARTELIRKTAKYGLAFGIDFFWQLGSDWNTDMPGSHRVARATIAGGVGVGAGWLTGVVLSAVGITAWWAVIPVAVVVGIVAEEPVKNELFRVFGVAHD